VALGHFWPKMAKNGGVGAGHPSQSRTFSLARKVAKKSGCKAGLWRVFAVFHALCAGSSCMDSKFHVFAIFHEKRGKNAKIGFACPTFLRRVFRVMFLRFSITKS